MENIHDRLTRALDEALEMTFPASDPIALTPPLAAATEPQSTRAANK